MIMKRDTMRIKTKPSYRQVREAGPGRPGSVSPKTRYALRAEHDFRAEGLHPAVVTGSAFIARLHETNREELIRLIKAGLPIASFKRLRSDLDIPFTALARVANIALRTLARRKKEGKFSANESERVLRFALLFEKAVDVLGSAETARQWLKTPKKALGGKLPLDYADTEPGAREVEELLGRIEYGIFS